jgi:GNAT superfamily N-acetyltransferase
MEIKSATTEEHIRSCYPVMHQLRPHLSDEDAFLIQVQRQREQGYLLAYLLVQGKVKAVMGYRFLEFLAWGKVLYIDDLITDSNVQRAGYGSTLLRWVIEEAKKAGCDQVHLDSGSHRHDAHRLYLNHGFKIIGYHFALNFTDPEYIFRKLVECSDSSSS